MSQVSFLKVTDLNTSVHWLHIMHIVEIVHHVDAARYAVELSNKSTVWISDNEYIDLIQRLKEIK